MVTLVFAHIPKTAGTSISNSLCSLFDPGRINRDVNATPPSSTEELDLIVSHTSFYKLEHLEGQKAFITCLRKPISRLVSLYRFWHSLSDIAALQAGNIEVLDIRAMTFEEFLLSEAPHFVEMMDNGMVRHFTEVRDRVEEADFEKACSAIDKMSAILLYERLSETMMHMYHRMECSHRFSLTRTNVTSDNHKSDAERYKEVGEVDVSKLSNRAKDALIRSTAYDLRLYNYATARQGGITDSVARKLTNVPLRRTTLMRGETVMPSYNTLFADLLCGGWAALDTVQWTTAPLATLKFKVSRDGRNQPGRIRITFSGCLIPRRDYIIASVSVDGCEPKTVLFLNSNITFEASDFEMTRFNLICTGGRAAEVVLPLANDVGFDAVHKVEFRCDGTSPPALLANNDDGRPLGIRLESLQLL